MIMRDDHAFNSFSIIFLLIWVKINPNSKHKNLNFNPHAGLAVITTESSFIEKFVFLFLSRMDNVQTSKLGRVVKFALTIEH